MPETFSAEDEAALYALDGLTPTERRKFEARLAESAELRALVRDFEEGAVALTLTAAPKGLPKGSWAKIEGEIRKEAGGKSIIFAIWTGWWRQGWAAAAACLAGWLIYAIWTNRSNPADAQSGTTQLAQSGAGKVGSERNAAAPRGVAGGNGGLSEAMDGVAASQLRVKEITALRREVLDLEARLTNLSGALAQQESMLGESNRVRIFQLTPNGAGDGTNGAPSPEMQRALFLAMAQQMGWAPQNGGGGTNLGGVHFMDLRPNSEAAANGATITPSADETGPATTPQLTASNEVASIPAYQSESNIFMAIDSSVAPSGSQVTVTSSDGSTSNSATTDGGTTIIAVPTGMGVNGWYLTISGGGVWTNFYQYIANTTNNP